MIHNKCVYTPSNVYMELTYHFKWDQAIILSGHLDCRSDWQLQVFSKGGPNHTSGRFSVKSELNWVMLVEYIQVRRLDNIYMLGSYNGIIDNCRLLEMIICCSVILLIRIAPLDEAWTYDSWPILQGKEFAGT